MNRVDDQVYGQVYGQVNGVRMIVDDAMNDIGVFSKELENNIEDLCGIFRMHFFSTTQNNTDLLWIFFVDHLPMPRSKQPKTRWSNRSITSQSSARILKLSHGI